MIKNIAIALSASLLISACSDDGDTESSNSSANTATLSSGTTTTTAVTKETACVVGTYGFKTLKDGKTHFTASFDGAGNIAYNLRDQSKGVYSVSGNKVTFTKLSGSHSGTLVWTISKQQSNCSVDQFRGNSAGGQPMTATRV